MTVRLILYSLWINGNLIAVGVYIIELVTWCVSYETA